MDSTPPTRTVLVTGATGKQGGAFISAALSSPSATDIHIRALTRDANSASAKALATSHPDGLTVVQADLDKPDTLRKVFEDEKAKGGVWGMFVVLAFPGLGADATAEEQQGKLCADLALEYKVQHLIFSSSERGGEGYDDHLKLDRLAKVRIERHIKSLDGLRWTILRPGFFMENFDGSIGKITTTVLRVGLKKDTRLQLIAADDIGHVAFGVFQASEENASKAIPVIGDALTTQQINEAFTKGSGKPLPAVPNFLGKTLLAINKHTKDLIADIERVHTTRSSLPESYEDLIAQCRALYPGMQTMEAWAAGRGTKQERSKGWNKVSVSELAMGKR